MKVGDIVEANMPGCMGHRMRGKIVSIEQDKSWDSEKQEWHYYPEKLFRVRWDDYRRCRKMQDHKVIEIGYIEGNSAKELKVVENIKTLDQFTK